MENKEISNLIKELIEKTGVTTIQVTEAKENAITRFSVEVNEPHFFTGKDGEALYALNHLVRRIVESKISPEKSQTDTNPALSILVDVNDFQKKRMDNIRAIAHMMSERARYFKSNIEVDPMPAFDRRIIHEFLSDAADLKTESIGIGRNRRVVIRYIGSI